MELTPEQIGERGEDHFKSLCTQSNLIAHKPDKDLKGWDFIVEFHEGLDPNDLSESYPEIKVQVKTVNSSKMSISMYLSVYRSLVEYKNPSYICLNQLDKNGQVKATYLKHIWVEEIKRLTKEIKKCKKIGKKLNEKQISIKFSQSEKLSVNLIDVLKSDAGLKHYEYSKNKQMHLDEILYYKKESFKMTFKSIEDRIALSQNAFNEGIILTQPPTLSREVESLFANSEERQDLGEVQIQGINIKPHARGIMEYCFNDKTVKLPVTLYSSLALAGGLGAGAVAYKMETKVLNFIHTGSSAGMRINLTAEKSMVFLDLHELEKEFSVYSKGLEGIFVTKEGSETRTKIPLNLNEIPDSSKNRAQTVKKAKKICSYLDIKHEASAAQIIVNEDRIITAYVGLFPTEESSLEFENNVSQTLTALLIPIYFELGNTKIFTLQCYNIELHSGNVQENKFLYQTKGVIKDCSVQLIFDDENEENKDRIFSEITKHGERLQELGHNYISFNNIKQRES